MTAAEQRMLQTWLAEADAVLVGMGAGLSAAGGLNYGDKDCFQRLFPAYAAKGYRTIWETITSRWDLTPKNKRAYWGYMARHIQVVRYETPPLPPYLDLCRLLQGRDYFILSTNADGQAEKSGMEPARLYTPQGDYALFQCERPCRSTLYPNKAWIDAMAAHIDPETLEAREEDIPYCPHCGSLLVPNLRKDAHFADGLHQEGYPRYQKFLERTAQSKLLLLELGVGYNTPGIIRYPFERLAVANPKARLARINLDDPVTPAALGPRGLGLECDIASVLRSMAETRAFQL